MPTLDEVTYSRAQYINAIQDYYHFLTKLYLDDSDIIQPPRGGWPDITADTLQDLGKTDEVVSLLRSLPYIRTKYNDDDAQGAPWCRFTNWEAECGLVNNGECEVEDIKVATKGTSYPDDIPAHVVGLTTGEDDNGRFLLDTELGVIYSMGCEGAIIDSASREPIDDDAYDYAEENQAEWRAQGTAWAVANFFEVLKGQFRKLKFVPINEKEVKNVYATYNEDMEEALRELQGIYREHGWPDVERYRKRECMDAVRAAMERRGLA